MNPAPWHPKPQPSAINPKPSNSNPDQVTSLLLEAGADLDAVDEDECTPLEVERCWTPNPVPCTKTPRDQTPNPKPQTPRREFFVGDGALRPKSRTPQPKP